MVYVALWILFIPILYVAYYSHFTNVNEVNSCTSNLSDSEILEIVIPKRRKTAFLLAISGPIGLTIYMTGAWYEVITILWCTGQFKNPIMIFPLHSPWEEDK